MERVLSFIKYKVDLITIMENITSKYDLLLMVTNRCNHKCKFCYVRKEGEQVIDLSLSRKLKDFLIERKNDFSKVHLLGGEPSLYPYLEELVKILSDNGYNILMESNGAKLNDKKLVSYLIKNNVSHFILGFHDIDEKILLEQTNSNYAFKEIYEAIHTIIRMGGKVCVNLVVNTFNYQRLIKLCKFLYENGVKEYLFSLAIPPLHIKYDPMAFIINFQDLYPHLNSAVVFLKQKKTLIKIQYFPYCILKDLKIYRESSFMNKYYVIDETGHVYLNNADCTYHSCIKRQECLKCIYNKYCSGVIKDYIKKIGWKEFSPIMNI